MFAFVLAAALSVDLLALGGFEGRTPEAGWATNRVVNYKSDHNNALRFAVKESYIRSPVYEKRIQTLNLTSFSSTNHPTRVLVVIPIQNGEPMTDARQVLTPSAKPYAPTPQTVSFARQDKIHQFQIQYEGTHSTSWALKELSIDFHEPRPLVIRIR